MRATSHEVVTARDAESALRELSDRAFDVLLTDLELPGLSGWDVPWVAVRPTGLRTVRSRAYAPDFGAAPA